MLAIAQIMPGMAHVQLNSISDGIANITKIKDVSPANRVNPIIVPKRVIIKKKDWMRVSGSSQSVAVAFCQLSLKDVTPPSSVGYESQEKGFGSPPPIISFNKIEIRTMLKNSRRYSDQLAGRGKVFLW